MSDWMFWTFLAVAVPGLFLSVAIVWWKGRSVLPVAVLTRKRRLARTNRDGLSE